MAKKKEPKSSKQLDPLREAADAAMARLWQSTTLVEIAPGKFYIGEVGPLVRGHEIPTAVVEYLLRKGFVKVVQAPQYHLTEKGMAESNAAHTRAVKAKPDR
jgi:hypothetical protein